MHYIRALNDLQEAGHSVSILCELSCNSWVEHVCRIIFGQRNISVVLMRIAEFYTAGNIYYYVLIYFNFIDFNYHIIIPRSGGRIGSLGMNTH